MVAGVKEKLITPRIHEYVCKIYISLEYKHMNLYVCYIRKCEIKST